MTRRSEPWPEDMVGSVYTHAIRRRTFIVGGCLLAAALPARARASSTGLDEATEARIDRLVQRTLRKWAIPGGYVLGLVADGRLARHRAYGMRDAETKAPMPRDAVFPIASVTKTFTAILAVKLAAAGRVRLDAPVSAYLPPHVRFHPSLDGVPVTLVTLLTHRTGWPKDQSNRRNLALSLLGGFDPGIADPASYARETFYRGLRETPVESQPLVEHSYSNMGVHLAGHVLELATGRSYEALLRDELLTPLGLQGTAVHPAPPSAARIPTGYAYDERLEAHVKVPTWTAGEIAGGAGLKSTVPDLARYVGVLMDPRASARLLGGRGWDAKLWRPYVEYVRNEETLYAQGLGWRMSCFGDYGTIYRHNGHADGHNAFVAFSREHRLGVILLTNSAHAAMEELGNRVLLAALQRAAGSGRTGGSGRSAGGARL